MPKKINEEKIQAFIEYYTSGDTAGNASASAKKAGWVGDSRNMGKYIKKKYATEIAKHAEVKMANNKAKMAGVSEEMIDVMVGVARNSQNDMCKIKSAEKMLDYAGYSNPQNINLNVEKEQLKQLSDQELAEKIASLSKKNPHLRKAMKETASDDEQIIEQDVEAPEEDQNRLTH